MRESHAVVQFPSRESSKGKDQPTGFAKLQAFLEKRRCGDCEPAMDMETFEQEAHAVFAEAERDLLQLELGRLDINEPVVEVDGVLHRQVERCEETYFSAAGPVRVERSLYSTRIPGEKAICPMEYRAGIIEGRWTPLAAKQAIWAVAHLTPGECEELFKRMGNMAPSKSSLDRLPKQLSREWEAKREVFEAALRKQEVTPKEAASVGVSLDGVMLRIKGRPEAAHQDEGVATPSKDAVGDSPKQALERHEKKAPQASREGAPKREADRQKKATESRLDDEEDARNPYHEAGCGTVTLYDKEGEVLSVVRHARMPEKGKKTLKAILISELTAVLAVRPDLIVQTLADGAKDNWTFLSQELPKALPPGKKPVETLDFFHGAEHLEEALAAYYPEDKKKRRSQYEKLRHILRHEEGGQESVIRSLKHMADEKAQSKVLRRELKYFRRNRRRMDYAKLKKNGLAIGTGIQEAACKTLVVQRARRSGICWGPDGTGGQAILTFRALTQSNRFDRAWDLLRRTYVQNVSVPGKTNVIPLGSRTR